MATKRKVDPRTLTPTASAVYVVLGGEQSGLYGIKQWKGIMPKASYTAPLFPLSIMARNLPEAKEFAKVLFPVIEQVKHKTDADEVAAFLESNPVLKGFKNPLNMKFHAVLFSSAMCSCVYLSWGDADVAMEGCAFKKSSSFSTLGEAFAFLCRRPRNLKPPPADSSHDNQDLSISMQDLDIGSASPSRQVAASNDQSDVTPAKTVRLNVKDTKGSGAEQAQADPTVDVNDKTMTDTVLAQGENTQGSKGMKPPASRSASPSKKHRNAGARTVDKGPAALVIARVCNSAGDITATITSHVTKQTVVPRLGYVVDSMVDAFGFDDLMVRRLHHAYLQASGVQEDFVIIMAGYQMPMLEASWFFQFIDIKDNVPTRMRNSLVIV
ncbi:hypothetical protein K474DRAFT_1711340 [Panus rudis PR-1116 ss-1]|nr:hypothetical protein K474DRAFT_1711340 [Panus rudis PR-1116 ss-1]